MGTLIHQVCPDNLDFLWFLKAKIRCPIRTIWNIRQHAALLLQTETDRQ